MEIVRSAEELRAVLPGTVRLGFVPTMGNLHGGHLALVRASRAQTERTVVSIFVNPFQFAAGEDFATYPRTLDDDVAKLEAENADYLFLPRALDIYPAGADRSTIVEVPELSNKLCGQTRPYFFEIQDVERRWR